MKNKLIQKIGFTLIELLIVVALLGILAVGLLAAIDPIEQIQKGRDTTTLSQMKEFVEAEQRYYANNGAYTITTAQNQVQLSTGFAADLTTLQATGELKTNYGSAANTANLSRVYITSNGTNTLVACFQILSKSIHAGPSAIYTSNAGATGAACPSTNMATACWACVQ